MSGTSNAMLAIADAVARLPHESGRFDEGMCDLVQRVGHLLGFRTACVVCLDVSTWAVSKIYGDDSRFPSPALVDDFILEFRLKESVIADLVLWRNSLTTSSREPGAVACVAALDEKQAVVLVGEWGTGFGDIKEAPQFLRDTTGILAAVVARQNGVAATEQDRQQLEAHARLEAFGVFADGIAHEINNVLAAVMGYAEMARDALDERSAPREYVEIILETAAQTQHMVEQILQFTRIRDKPFELFGLQDALNEILADLHTRMDPGIDLIVKAKDAAVALEGHRPALREVLVNLCRNATEAMPDGGRLTISVDLVDISTSCRFSHGQLPPGNYVKISVEDGGSGIGPEHFGRIAEPFYTTKTGGKEGLGLFIVHGTVQLFNGAMHIASTPDTGTTVDVFLPRYEGTALPVNALDEDVDEPVGNGELIAVVDQALSSRLAWEERLAIEGYEAVAFASLGELADWRSRTGLTPDLLLIDIQDDSKHFAAAMDEPQDLRLGYILARSAPLSKGYGATGNPVLVRKPVSQKELARVLSLVFRASGFLPAS